jgi:hypothetical protein
MNFLQLYPNNSNTAVLKNIMVPQTNRRLKNRNGSSSLPIRKTNHKMCRIVFVFALISAAGLIIPRLQSAENIQISSQNVEQTEPSIAVNPKHPDNLIAAFINATEDICEVYFSYNTDGESWAPGRLNMGDRNGCADPSVAFDSDGNAYFAGFFYDRDDEGNFINNRIGVSKSTNRGIRFGSPVMINTTELEDKPYITIDNTGGARDGTIYVPFTTVDPDDPFDRKIRIAVSTDHGESFTVNSITSTGNNWGAHAAVGPDGEVYVAWRNFFGNTIQIAKSTDGSSTWSNPVTVCGLGSDLFQSPPDRVTRIPVVAVSHAPETRGKVYVAYHENSPSFTSLPDREGYSSTMYDGINKYGHAVGTCYDPSSSMVHGFLLKNGTFHTIDPPEATTIRKLAINDLEQIAGSYIDGTGQHIIFTWFSNSFKIYDLAGYQNPQGTLPIFPSNLRVNAINNLGQIVGTYWDDRDKQHGFFLDTRIFPVHPDAIKIIDYPSINSNTHLNGINDFGMIIGKSDAGYFLYSMQNQTYTSIDNFASEINNANEITYQTQVKRGDVYIEVPGMIQAINNAGELIITSGTGTGNNKFGNPQDQDVFVSRSTDGGATWRRVRVNDHVAGDQYLPWICVAPNGRIHICWLDRRNDPENQRFDVYYATSLNGGRSFSANQRITPVSSNPDLAEFTSQTTGALIEDWMGEYIGLACTNDAAFPIWPDMRNGLGKQTIYNSIVKSTLIDNGNWTITDTELNRMWLQDALMMYTTGSALPDGLSYWSSNWAENLTFAGYSDWRLPSRPEYDNTCDDHFAGGYNCTGSEMGGLYYLSLGNLAGGPLTNKGPFKNLLATTDYIEYDPITGDQILIPFTHGKYWTFPENRYFNFKDGYQDNDFLVDSRGSTIAVREIPPINTLFGVNVPVNLGSGITINFNEVLDEGHTSIEITDENPGSDYPDFQFLGTFYNIQTDAEINGGATICMNYQHSDIPGCTAAGCPLVEQGLNITDRPDYPDIAQNIVCGSVSSLSWFALSQDMRPLRIVIRLYPGLSIPTGPYASHFNNGYNFMFNYDHRISQHLSIAGYLGYHTFQSKIADIDDDTYVNLSANIKYNRSIKQPFSICINAGPGIYFPKKDKTNWGTNLGLGVQYDYNARLAFEIGTNYHFLFTDDIQFLQNCIGLIYRF